MVSIAMKIFVKAYFICVIAVSIVVVLSACGHNCNHKHIQEGHYTATMKIDGQSFPSTEVMSMLIGNVYSSSNSDFDEVLDLFIALQSAEIIITAGGSGVLNNLHHPKSSFAFVKHEICGAKAIFADDKNEKTVFSDFKIINGSLVINGVTEKGSVPYTLTFQRQNPIT
jgi:hypothetical protein